MKKRVVSWLLVLLMLTSLLPTSVLAEMADPAVQTAVEDALPAEAEETEDTADTEQPETPEPPEETENTDEAEQETGPQLAVQSADVAVQTDADIKEINSAEDFAKMEANISASLATVKDGDKVLWFEGTIENLFQGPTWEELSDSTLEWETISTVDKLLELAGSTNDDVLAKNYKLADDLDLTDVAFPGIGSADHPFTGRFDGQNKTISNVTVTGSTNVGFFNVIKGATVKNLNLANVNITGATNVGGLVGENSGSITASSASGAVTGGTVTGGLAGSNTPMSNAAKLRTMADSVKDFYTAPYLLLANTQGNVKLTSAQVDRLINVMANGLTADNVYVWSWGGASGTDYDTTATALAALQPYKASSSSARTLADKLLTALEGTGITQVGASNGYVRSISKDGTTYGEFTSDPNSGWLYKVNGVLPNVPLTQKYISNGDSILWYYTTDWTQDPDAGKMADEELTAEDVIKLIDAIGTVTKDSGSAIAAARTAYNKLSAQQKALVTNYNKLVAAEAAYAALLKELAEKAGATSVTGWQKRYLDALDAVKTDKLAFGSEWLVIALARSGRDVPQSYYDSVVEAV